MLAPFLHLTSNALIETANNQRGKRGTVVYANNKNPESSEFDLGARHQNDSNNMDSKRRPNQFPNREAFASWLKVELEKLEASFSDFTTVGSFHKDLGR